MHKAQIEPCRSLPEQSAQPQWAKNKVEGFCVLPRLAAFCRVSALLTCWEQLFHIILTSFRIYNHKSIWASLDSRNTHCSRNVWYLTFPVTVPKTAERMVSLLNFNQSKFASTPATAMTVPTQVHSHAPFTCTFILSDFWLPALSHSISLKSMQTF